MTDDRKRDFATFSANADGDEVRLERSRETPYLVAPVVMVREGILNGGFLSYEEIAASEPGWNGRPLTAPPAPDASGHPTEDGEFVSANRAPFFETMTVGHLRNVEADTDTDSLRGEVWVNLDHADEVGEQAVEAARRMAEGEELEVSTGYFHRPVRQSGTYEGETYEVEQRDLMPDHLALLPNETGACSWADGCGAPRTDVPEAAANTPAVHTDGSVCTTVEAAANTTGLAPYRLAAACSDGCTCDPPMSNEPNGSASNEREGLLARLRSLVGAEDIAALVAVGDVVRWPSAGDRPAYGRVTDTIDEGEQYDSEIDGDQTVDGPAALIDVYAPDGDEWAETETTVAHRTDTDTLDVLDGFPDATAVNVADDATPEAYDGPETNSDTDTDTMTDYTISDLAANSAFAEDELNEWGDDDLATLAESLDLDANADGDGGNDPTDDSGEGDDDPEAQANNDGDSDELTALRERVEELEAETNAEKRADLVDAVVANTGYDREAVESLDTDALETLADESPDGGAAQDYAGQAANRVNYVGQAGATDDPTDADEDADEYTANVGALRTLEQREQAGGD